MKWQLAAILVKRFFFGLLAAGVLPQVGVAANDDAQVSALTREVSAHSAVIQPSETRPANANRPKRANFERTRASRDARHMADWIVDSADNGGLPFVIVDKKDARVFVFFADGRLRGAAPALIGLARGDDTVPGIGDREYSDMPPETRTTPAGRFVAEMGMDARNEDVLWIDYEAAVSLHRVITTKPEERRLERLATPTPLDNRISYGCINVPKQFYETVVSPAFTGTNGIVYVLPETRTVREVFGSYDVEERAQPQTASRTITPLRSQNPDPYGAGTTVRVRHSP